MDPSPSKLEEAAAMLGTTSALQEVRQVTVAGVRTIQS